ERGQMHRASPDVLDVGQGVRRLVEPQLDARVLVLEQQLAAVAVVAVYYIDPRFSEVSQAEQEALLDFLEIARLDVVLAGLLGVGEREEPVADAERGGEEGVDEGDVVVDAADLKDLLPAQA